MSRNLSEMIDGESVQLYTYEIISLKSLNKEALKVEKTSGEC